jgi:hypothetical protein
LGQAVATAIGHIAATYGNLGGTKYRELCKELDIPPDESKFNAVEAQFICAGQERNSYALHQSQEFNFQKSTTMAVHP